MFVTNHQAILMYTVNNTQLKNPGIQGGAEKDI